MPLTYENLVRGVFLLLLIVGSLSEKTVSPTITLIAFVVFELLLRKYEKPIAPKDHSKELADLQQKQAILEEKFKEIKADLSIGNISAAIQRRK